MKIIYGLRFYIRSSLYLGSASWVLLQQAWLLPRELFRYLDEREPDISSDGRRGLCLLIRSSYSVPGI